MTESKESKHDDKSFELYDIRKELINIEYSLNLLQKNCNTLNINLKKSEIVQKEIEKLSDNTRIYESIGRIFALTNKENALKTISCNKKTMIKELDEQSSKKKYLQKSLEEKTKAYLEVAKQATVKLV